MVAPYLPDIIDGCVSRLSDSFAARSQDPFAVFFDKGILPQVRRSVYKADGNFPLVWLVMKYFEDFGTDATLHSVANFQMIIAMPTDNNYTQQQREDISFSPRLIPIAEQLVKEITREKWFNVPPKGLRYGRTLLPYWGLADVNGTDVPNLFKKYIDAIAIDISGLKIKKENCSLLDYPLLNATCYPIIQNELMFFDDLELIVDAGQDTDPVSGQSSVVIPFLIGKDYEVQQRGVGQLRQRRNVEIIPDTINGGFSLTNGSKFNTGDTYFVIIRPMYQS
jgi:hypothetical protein